MSNLLDLSSSSEAEATDAKQTDTAEEKAEDPVYADIVRVLRPLDPGVGIEWLAQQYVRRVVADHYSFNVMLLGQTGVGKSTLIDSLFRAHFLDDSTRSHRLSRVEVVANRYDLCENGVRIDLGVIECRGFDDQLTKDKSYEPIVDYINKQMDIYLEEELKTTHRDKCKDTRVHVCLYLISPVGHGLKAIDLVTMKELYAKCNLIPVIAKSDLITEQEMHDRKRRIMADIEDNGIAIYRFPTDDLEVAAINAKSNAKLPFALVASNDFVTVGQREVRARQYPWGTVEVENESHSDFTRLRDMLLRVNMNHLKETTHSQHYELYRSERLDQLLIETQTKHYSELNRIESELVAKYKAKFGAKDQELKNMERELHLKSEKWKKMFIENRDQLELSRQELEESIINLNMRKQWFKVKMEGNVDNDGKDGKDGKNHKSPKHKK